VQANVLLEHKNVAKLLVAHGTLMERPHGRLYSVNTHVRLQIALCRERSSTYFAPEWPIYFFNILKTLIKLNFNLKNYKEIIPFASMHTIVHL
jgi:hypothetical protein